MQLVLAAKQEEITIANLKAKKVWTGHQHPNQLSNCVPLQGRVIHEQFQKTTIAKAKKLTAFWLEAYPNGIPSGQNKEDCLLFVLKMYYVEHDEKKSHVEADEDSEDEAGTTSYM